MSSLRITEQLPRTGLPERRGGPVPGRRTVRVRLLLELRVADLLNALNLGWSVKCVLAAIVVLTAAGGVLVCVVAGLVAHYVVDRGAQAPTVFASALLAAVYAGFGMLLREELGRFRTTVSAHPHREFFRAFDVPAAYVYLVHVLPRIGVQTGFWVCVALGLTTGWMAATGVGPLNWWWPALLLLVPVLFAVWTAGSATRSAVEPSDRAIVRWPMVAGVVCLTGTGGLLAGAAAQAWYGGPVDLPLARPLAATMFSAGAGATGVILAVAALVLAAVRWRRHWLILSTTSFLRTGTTYSGASAWTPRATTSSAVLRVLLREGRGGWRSRVHDRVQLAVIATAAFLLGMRITGLDLLAAVDHWSVPATDVERVVGTTVLFIALLTGLGVAELVVGDLGALRFGMHLRTAVESGARVSTVAVGHFAALTVPVLFIAVAFSVAAVTVVGPRGLQTGLVVLGAVWATVVAERLLPPPVTTEGSAGESPLTAVASVVLAALPVAIPLTFPWSAPGAVPVLVLALAGGAYRCLLSGLLSRSSS